jgi:hypothetical protein
MGYRIRVVPEVEVWLQQLRDSDPSAADLVDDALDTLREAGAGLGPPAVVPVEIPAAAAVEEASAAISDALAEVGEPNPHVTIQEDWVIESPTVMPRRPASPPLSELRPGAPESDDIRILFTVDHAVDHTGDHAGTALLLAAGTERDWLQAWYTEMLIRCRARYEHDRGSTG